MIDSTLLLPPGSGLRTNPVLFGVSEGLAQLLPLPDDTLALPWQAEGGGEGAGPVQGAEQSLSEAGGTG
ncbi:MULTISPECIES: hypothetical protein [Methylorubrum]|uniref:Uncharacterized protein n=1 Tax=Methylorubrum thiocyanatum TaxID=47958 RepID=A0AA40RZJ9_9HYPH|nr:hypothetical protein [Methylorubrum thiocyanatum]MBA8911846.1 hypothetical protein [Methylorubrum thiocyanatum]GJE79861.1 hypothetical protein CJNNKLLH_1191 [Methylorubrum thiocyanatum]